MLLKMLMVAAPVLLATVLRITMVAVLASSAMLPMLMAVVPVSLAITATAVPHR